MIPSDGVAGSLRWPTGTAATAHDDTSTFDDGWPSPAAYLHEVAEVLHHGGTVGDEAPYLTSDGELWWSFEGETDLNGTPLVPAPTSPGS
ncbi:hypothetical protein [Yinghuangia seranimata]|uniref:hypothetical protein n=1 Tax=Yinghuangia seranimata TaxID=408067 RepID=UPI00248C769A|nr:hypothetical protein [Yinghuangia seranimata]MDI2131148.1 hypothetical protein [Yinghuangia seranimata]